MHLSPPDLPVGWNGQLSQGMERFQVYKLTTGSRMLSVPYAILYQCGVRHKEDTYILVLHTQPTRKQALTLVGHSSTPGS